MFETVGIRDLRNFESAIFALRAQLMERPTHYHEGCLIGSCSFPFNIPPIGPLKLLKTKLQDLKVLETLHPPLYRAPKPQWMSK